MYRLPQVCSGEMASRSELVQLPPLGEQCHSYGIEEVA